MSQNGKLHYLRLDLAAFHMDIRVTKICVLVFVGLSTEMMKIIPRS